MLPESLIPNGFETYEKEEWDHYKKRMNLPNDEALLQFYRQVVYDHFNHFNYHYPSFDIENYCFEILEMTAKQAGDTIRYFCGEIVDWWADQYDDFASKNQDYIIYQKMSVTGTFPFPPILLDAKLIDGEDWRECGYPLHLIEGTHRVSYLRHMLEKGIISPTSMHTFVLVRPVE